jgi:deazaflavin-dependent oxidoreductase (nitroreductase family)
VIALTTSRGRTGKHPRWYLNLKVNAKVRVQIKREGLDLKARDATEAQRDDYWERLVQLFHLRGLQVLDRSHDPDRCLRALDSFPPR